MGKKKDPIPAAEEAQELDQTTDDAIAAMSVEELHQAGFQADAVKREREEPQE